VVQSVPGAGHHDDPLRVAGQGNVEGQGEVGRVLGLGMALDRDARLGGRSQHARVHGVHVANDGGHIQAELQGRLQPRVGGDHGGGSGAQGGELLRPTARR
jgi:hypothetical protein